MTLPDTIARFTTAMNWNAALYIVYKVIFTSMSIALYYYLPTNDYSLWANINSIIFLFLLWIDCGMRKSVPRFSPEFLFSPTSTRHFLIGISVLQVAALFLIMPLLYTSLLYTAFKLNQTIAPVMLFGMTIFFTQGIIAILRLIFHSYFLQKQFNLLAIIIMCLELLPNLFFFFTSPCDINLIYKIFSIKICADIILIGASVPLLIKHISTLAYDLDVPIGAPRTKRSERSLAKQFVLHSFIMWVGTALKSLTERNFLVPFLTHTVGPEMANLFKVANDSALIFYRFILKTIGTADTSLLTYINMRDKKEELNNAFKKLISKITGLCLPLLGFVVLVALYRFVFFERQFVFQIFIIMAICYLIETLLLPFERILEIKKSYFLLIIGLIPYIIAIILMTNRIFSSSIGMITIVLFIHSVRLVSSILYAYFACRMYGITFTRYFF